jgi:ribosomal protein S17
MPVKQQIGIVISNKMQKSIVVKIEKDIHIQCILRS